MNPALVALAALLLPCPVQRSSVQQGTQAPATVEATRSVTLSALRAQPGRYLGLEVRFVLQFRALVEDWNPYLSRFEPARWLALEVWPDEALNWERAAFETPARRLFVRRGGGFEPLVRRARIYQRFEVRARVREAFLGEAWLELLELVPLEGEVGEGTILHVTRARELAAEGQFDLALDQYERARSAPLSPHALAAVLEEIRATQAARERAEAEGAKQVKRE
ncbi:MAG: hypothetical protein HOP15_09115 [Planctomycetes bacterium]|nr:hypothetical protein [Planctomycetota bacterium]